MKILAVALVLLGSLLIAGFFVGSLSLSLKDHGHDVRFRLFSMEGLGIGAWLLVGGVYLFVRKMRGPY